MSEARTSRCRSVTNVSNGNNSPIYQAPRNRRKKFVHGWGKRAIDLAKLFNEKCIVWSDRIVALRRSQNLQGGKNWWKAEHFSNFRENVGCWLNSSWWMARWLHTSIEVDSRIIQISFCNCLEFKHCKCLLRFHLRMLSYVSQLCRIF